MVSYIIQFDICACIVSTLTIALFLCKKDWKRVQNRLFLVLAGSQLLSAVADIAGSILLRSEYSSQWITRFVLELYYAFHITSVATFASYILRVTGQHKFKDRHFYAFFFLLYALCLVGIFANAFTHWLIFVDAAGTLVRRPYYFVYYAVAFFYFFTSIYYISRYREGLSTTQVTSILVLLGVAMISAVLQAFFETLLIELFIQAIMTLGMLVAVDNYTESYNPNTEVFSRRAFMIENISAIKNHLTYKVVIIKLLNERYYMATFGYLFIQSVLYKIAQYLVAEVGEDSVYDCENGTFALVLYKMPQEKCEILLKKLEAKFMQDWDVQNINVNFNTQIAVVDIPADLQKIEDLATLIDSTDTKASGRVSVIQKEQLHYLQRRALVENAIEKALQKNTFSVHYQPIWNCKQNKIHSAEALVRLIDPEVGYISPEEFIPYSEKNGTVTAIGQFVFEEVCHLFTHEHLEDIGLKFIEVNLSTVQCMHKTLPEIFKNTLEHYGLSSQKINLEITESAAINSQETFLKTIESLKDLGFSFSLDDYGTGYSNANYIFNMDFNIIKIDKSILWEAEKKSSGKIILKNTVRMIKEMGMKILVEGVETEEQKNMVVNLGCDYCQGFYFSRPVPKDDFIAYCKQFNSQAGQASYH